MSLDTSTIDSTLYSQISSETKYASASGSSSSTGLGTDDFLTLITTELQNQDPTNPMDNSELISQFSQLANISSMQDLTSTVSDGISSMGSTLDNIYQLLSSSLQSNTADATAYLGRTVRVWSDTGVLPDDGSLVGGAYCSDGTASEIRIDVSDSDGNVVASYDLTPDDDGWVNFSWDGTGSDGSSAAAGEYSLAATAYDSSGDALDASTYTEGYVDSVYPSDAYAEQLINIDGLGKMAISSVIEVS